MKTKTAKMWNLVGGFVLSLVVLSSAWGQGMCTPNGVEGPIVIYGDSVIQGWNTAWSWGNTASPTDDLVMSPDNKALKVVMTSGTGGGLELHLNYQTTKNTANHSKLLFKFRKDMTATATVGIRGTDNLVPVFVPISSYIVTSQSTALTNGQWDSIAVPLSDLQAVNKDIGGVVFMTSALGTMYVDDVMIGDAFLGFPLKCSTGLSGTTCPAGHVDYRTKGPMTASAVATVMDHSMKKNVAPNPFYAFSSAGTDADSLDGVVTAWTGEMGQQGTPVFRGCYPRLGGGTFSLAGTYVSDTACTTSKLSYDDHPGYDYKADYNTPVYAVATGFVVNDGGDVCYKNNLPGSCVANWGAVGIDHGNGYVSQYLHMIASSITVTPGQYITEGQEIGRSGYTGLADITASHLHFEVLRKITTNGVSTYKMVDPYGWSSLNTDPLQVITGEKNIWLWK